MFLVQPASGKLFPSWFMVQLLGLAGLLFLAAVVVAEQPAEEPTPSDTPPFPAMPPSLPPLSAELLNRVTDSQPLPVLPDGFDKIDLNKLPPAKARQLDRDLSEFEVYCEALEKAYRFKAPSFASAVRSNLNLTPAHLMQEPRKYRGEIVHVEGHIRRVRRFDPPMMSAQAGVRDLYEGWLFDKAYGASPICLVFTDLPDGLSIAEKMDQPATFDGYFFKRYKYQAADGKAEGREAPLLIGNAPVLTAAPVVATAPADNGWSTSLLVGFMVLFLCSVGLALWLTWWFRKGDRHVRSRIASATAPTFVDPVPSALPVEGPTETTRTETGDESPGF
jgi:hypothetical protein